MPQEVYRIIYKPTPESPKNKTIITVGGSFDEVRKKFLSLFGDRLIEIRYILKENAEKS